MWTDESSTRREQTVSEVNRCERMYKTYLDRLKTPNGRAPQAPRLGEKLNGKLKDVRSKFKQEKRRKQQELTTNEFFKNI